jgi:hypothetical protein
MHVGFRFAFAAVMACLLVKPATSFAQPEEVAREAQPALPGGFHADAEIDPTAYVLKGFSLHVGLGWKHWRLDLGNFALAVPQFFHGNSDYDVSFDGYGAKLQYFLFAEQTGGFLGIDGGANKLYLERRGTDLAARQTQYGLGVDAGWRFRITSGLYLTTWAGLSYVFNAHDVTLADSTYKRQPLSPFAALHIGYRFL